MTVGTRVIAEARQWIGTPYLHQTSTRGSGADCLGLVRGIWRALYGEEPENVPPYTADWAEPSRQEVLLEAAHRWLIPKPVTEEALGDVILFRMRDTSIAKHLGLQAETGPNPRFIHAYSGFGVVESSLSGPWRRRVVARFVFPEGRR